MTKRLVLLVAGLLGLAPGAVSAQETHVLVIRGIGGADEYRERFQEWATQFVTSATERLGVPEENVIYLSERPDGDPIADGPARRDDIERAITGIAGATDTGDRVAILVIGHGSYNQGESKVNLPGPDLTSRDFGLLLDQLAGRDVLFVNTTPSSGLWVTDLSGPRRTIITATRSGMERNETFFGGFFVQAFSQDVADVDKDGLVSALEAYQYAVREVERIYETTDRIQTEHALLDDNGDGEGTEEYPEDAEDGALASTFVLGTAALAIPPTDDPELRALYERRAALERSVAELRAIRATMAPEDYEARLEETLLELALLNREIRGREGGGP